MSPTQTTAAAPAREIPSVSSTGGMQHSTIQPSPKSEVHNSWSSSPKPAGYGMPCAQCKTYYAANLTACPVCKATERVPVMALIKTNAPAVETVPNPAALEAERERFLREFKSQAYAASLQLGPTAATNCTREENHRGNIEPAIVCQGCFDQLQERVDVLEAVLHMDVKEAAEIIYDAVWSDPSDPTKTYQNAAQAMLSELKKRSGVTQVFGPLQPLQH